MPPSLREQSDPAQSSSEEHWRPSLGPPSQRPWNGSSNWPPEPSIRSRVARTPPFSTRDGVIDQVACTKPLASLVLVGPGNGLRRLRVARKLVAERWSSRVPV